MTFMLAVQLATDLYSIMDVKMEGIGLNQEGSIYARASVQVAKVENMLVNKLYLQQQHLVSKSGVTVVKRETAPSESA